MSVSILVMHYEDDRSNKVWAVDTQVNANGQYDVWWGPRVATLTHKTFDAKSNFVTRKVREKEGKGYVQKHDWSVENKKIIVLDGSIDNDQDEDIPAQLWYRANAVVCKDDVCEFVMDTLENLKQHDLREALSLEAKPTVQALMDGKLTGGVEAGHEGPLTVLLLFALRRHLNKRFPDQKGECFHIADDHNNLLPSDYFKLGALIENEAYAFAKHTGLLSLNDVYTEALKEAQFEHYLSLEGLKPFAIAMDCIEAPIDMSAIQTTTKAAFF